MLRDSKAEPQTIEGILDATQGCPIANLNDVEHLLDPGWFVHEVLELREFPLRGFPYELSLGQAWRAAKQTDCRDA